MRVVDTTVAVDHLRGVAAATDLLDHTLRAGDALAASEVLRFELLVGVRPAESGWLEDLLDALTWVPVDAEVARVGARLARQFRRSHSGIDDVDYLIAATALILDAELLTTNVRHFPMLPGLSAPY